MEDGLRHVHADRGPARGSRRLTLATLGLLLALSLAAGAIGSEGKGVDERDFGDAPDGGATGYDVGAAVGAFPSLAASNGASHKKVPKLLLGARVDAEADSNQVDTDPFDDGFSAVIRPCEETLYRFVIDASGMPERVLREQSGFLNVWADWNADGDWRDDSECAGEAGTVREWVVKNHSMPLKSFIKQPVQDIVVPAPAGDAGPQLWMRASLTTEKFAGMADVGGGPIRNDGRGAFKFGETEDYFAYSNGPAPEEPDAGEVPVCDPPGRGYLHNQAADMRFFILDAQGDPIPGTQVLEHITPPAPPLGWLVTPDNGGIGPGGQLIPPGATVDFPEDAPSRVQRGTLAFRIKSSATNVEYVATCDVEVLHEDAPPTGDYGDAPDDFFTDGTAFEGVLCVNNIPSDYCEYPSKGPHGPVHELPEPFHLGDNVNAEPDSNQVNQDFGDDGFEVLGPASCELTTFKWTVTLESPSDPDLTKKERRQARKLLTQVSEFRAKIYLNAWFDAGNDGAWDANNCSVAKRGEQEVEAPDHAVSDEQLSKGELKALRKSADKDGIRSIVVEREGLVGEIPAEGPGCWRGQVSSKQRYHDDASGVPAGFAHTSPSGFGALGRADGDVINPYKLGETEDYCGLADLTITKTSSPKRLTPGQQAQFDVLITNNSARDATNVLGADFPPPEVSFLGATPSQGGPCFQTKSGLIVCDLGNIPGGQTAQFTALVDVDSPPEKKKYLNFCSVFSDNDDTPHNDHCKVKIAQK